MSRVAELGGWIVLALSTLLVPVVFTGVPLTGAAVTASDVGVSLWLLALWIGAAWLSRNEVVGVAARAVLRWRVGQRCVRRTE